MILYLNVATERSEFITPFGRPFQARIVKGKKEFETKLVCTQAFRRLYVIVSCITGGTISKEILWGNAMKKFVEDKFMLIAQGQQMFFHAAEFNGLCCYPSSFYMD